MIHSRFSTQQIFADKNLKSLVKDMSLAQTETTLGLVPLCNFVVNSEDTPYSSAQQVVEYSSPLITQMGMLGVVDTSTKPILFCVGVTGSSGADLARTMDQHRVSTAMFVSEQIQRQVRDVGAKNMSMPVTWPRMDLFDIAMRAMMGIAHYSAWEVLTDVQLRGGGCSQLMHS